MNPVRAARHSRTLTGRAMLKIRHSPDQLLDVLLMPITFVLMFVFLFGNSVSGDWRSYLQYVLPGIAVQTLMFASMGTSLSLHTDVRTGVFDRFRSLPVARSAPLVGHVLGDLVKYLVCLVVVFGFGATLGFRFRGSALAVAGALGLLMVFAFAVCWIAALTGMLVRTPEGIQAVAFLLVLPLSFGSNIFVPVERLPGWLRAWVEINPLSHMADSARGLMLGLPTGDAVPYALLWIAGIIAVFGPLAVRAYLRRS